MTKKQWISKAQRETHNVSTSKLDPCFKDWVVLIFLKFISYSVFTITEVLPEFGVQFTMSFIFTIAFMKTHHDQKQRVENATRSFFTASDLVMKCMPECRTLIKEAMKVVCDLHSHDGPFLANQQENIYNSLMRPRLPNEVKFWCYWSTSICRKDCVSGNVNTWMTICVTAALHM